MRFSTPPKGGFSGLRMTFKISYLKMFENAYLESPSWSYSQYQWREGAVIEGAVIEGAVIEGRYSGRVEECFRCSLMR